MNIYIRMMKNSDSSIFITLEDSDGTVAIVLL